MYYRETGESPSWALRNDDTEAGREVLWVPPNRGGLSYAAVRLGRGVLVVDRAHHPRRAVSPLVVVEAVAPAEHNCLGLTGALEVVS